jgi:hypothetical protein
MFRMEPEVEYGNIEYKRKLTSNMSRIKSLATQLNWRLDEGSGIAIYYIGVDDDGSYYGITREIYKESYNAMYIMCNICNAYIYEENKQIINNKCIYKITIMIKNDIKREQRVLILGNNRNSYMSYMIYNNENCIDRVYNYEHECNSGIQSLIIKHIGIDQNNNILNLANCTGLYNMKEKSKEIVALFMLPDNRSIVPYAKLINNVIILDDENTKTNINLCITNKLPYNIVKNIKEIYINRGINTKYVGCIFILSIIKRTNNDYIVLLLNNSQNVTINSMFYGFIHTDESVALITIKSMRYFDMNISKVSENITFTAVISSKTELKKYKRCPLIKC